MSQSPLALALVTGGNMGANFTSDPIKVESHSIVAIQLVWSGGGSPSGTFKLQASCDVGKDVGTGPAGFSGMNWTDVGSSDQAITADGNHMWNIADAAYKWLRVVYTRASGTATLAINVYAKAK